MKLNFVFRGDMPTMGRCQAQDFILTAVSWGKLADGRPGKHVLKKVKNLARVLSTVLLTLGGWENRVVFSVCTVTKYPLIIVFWVTLGYSLDRCVDLTQCRIAGFASGRYASMGCVYQDTSLLLLSWNFFFCWGSKTNNFPLVSRLKLTLITHTRGNEAFGLNEETALCSGKTDWKWNLYRLRGRLRLCSHGVRKTSRGKQHIQHDRACIISCKIRYLPLLGSQLKGR